jgi:Peptidase family M23
MVLAVLATGVLTAVLPTTSASAGPPNRPNFKLPFTCNERWELKTYFGHNPDDKKIDMYKVGGGTNGAAARASAPGRVHQWFSPGGLEINHGNGWFTVYLHMSARAAVGTQVSQGQWIGTVGSVGTGAAHMHYEQLYDYNGDGDGETNEMVHPVIQGVEYHLSPNGPFPIVTSTNACSGGDPQPQPGNFSTWGSSVRVRQQPSTSAAVVTTFGGPTRVQVQCQQHAEMVHAEGYSNDAWSRLTSPVNGWISNIYIDHPAAWLPGIPDCGSSTDKAFRTWGTSVNIRQQPSTSAGVVRTLTGPTDIRVRCQKHAQMVHAEGYSNDAWSYLSSPVVGWISNIYVDDPAAWLPGVPTC